MQQTASTNLLRSDSVIHSRQVIENSFTSEYTHELLSFRLLLHILMLSVYIGAVIDSSGIVSIDLIIS